MSAKRRVNVSAEPVVQYPPLRTAKKRRTWLDRTGWFEIKQRPIETTTRQAAALRLSLVGRAGSEKAIFEGIDLFSGEPIFADPVSDYQMPDGPKTTTRVNIGDVGMGKSSSLKTTACLRPLLLGRRVVVVDKKMQGDEGEYAPIARQLGVQPIRFALDGSGVKINALDQQIATTTAAGGAGAGQSHLLRAILAEALNRPLREKEGKALRVAHQQAIIHAQQRNRVADIRDIVPALLHPMRSEVEQAGVMTSVSQGELREWGLDAAFALERMIEEDLAGLIDGPTDPRVQLRSAFTSFDISALPDDGPAVAIVMAIISSWLSFTLRNQGQHRVHTHFVVEEGWHLMRGSFGSVSQRNSKLARGIGLVPEFAIHHLSDIPKDSPAMAMCREAGTVRIFRQAHTEDNQAVITAFNLPEHLRDELHNLSQGSYILWQTGRAPRLVKAIQSEVESQLTNTDNVMLSNATMFDLLAQNGPEQTGNAPEVVDLRSYHPGQQVTHATPYMQGAHSGQAAPA